MDGRLKVEKPDEMVYEVTLRGTVKEFEKLRDQLQKEWPAHTLSGIITNVLAQARKIYWVEEESS